MCDISQSAGACYTVVHSVEEQRASCSVFDMLRSCGRTLFCCNFQNHEEKEPFGPGCRDYFWLICHLIDGITKEDVELSWEQVCSSSQQVY